MSVVAVKASKLRLNVAGVEDSEYVAVMGEENDVDGAPKEFCGVGKANGWSPRNSCFIR